MSKVLWKTYFVESYFNFATSCVGLGPLSTVPGLGLLYCFIVVAAKLDYNVNYKINLFYKIKPDINTAWFMWWAHLTIELKYIWKCTVRTLLSYFCTVSVYSVPELGLPEFTKLL